MKKNAHEMNTTAIADGEEMPKSDIIEPVQPPDTPGHDENGDGLKAGQATADTEGDVLGL